MFRYGLTAITLFYICGVFPASATQAAPFKVLVIMSYDKSYLFEKGIREGIDSVMEDTVEIRYFYMDTKRNLKDGPQKAKEAYALYQEFQPDGVIAADDNAQSIFVEPYLKGKVNTPVMFCGVNADAGTYGYPASNVSGILERLHIRESVAFAQQLLPSIRTVGYIMKGDSPSSKGIVRQIQSESDSYPAKSVGIKLPNTVKELAAMTEELRAQSDLLFMTNCQGIKDDNGVPLTEEKLIPIVANIFRKPVITDSAYRLKYGLLCAVTQRPREQGETAAKMLLRAMQGTPVSEIPITRNQKGKRVLNITVMTSMGIKPRPMILRNIELVRTEK